MSDEAPARNSANVDSTGGTSLLLRLQDEDPQAWKQLVRLYGPLIFEWCKVCQLKPADAADVMQEVFSAVSRKITTFRIREKGSFRGWLWRITQNKIRDHFRKLGDRPIAAGGTQAQLRMAEVEFPVEVGATGEQSSTDCSANSALDLERDPTTDRASYRLLHRALDQIKTEFSNKSWQAFWRSVVDQQQTSLIAEELGLSDSGVRHAKRRVLRRLKKQLGEIE